MNKKSPTEQPVAVRREAGSWPKGNRVGRHFIPPPGSASRRALKRRFPHLSALAIKGLDPFYRLRFRLQYKPDRRVLEKVIFPALLAEEGLRRVLFVGCAWYTRSYSEGFRDREFWTMDVDERARRYATERHVVASMTALANHFEPESLDVVICNGVVGFGLDSEEDCDRAFDGAYRALRPGGLLIVGWDDADGYRPAVRFDSLASLQAFQRHVLPPFPSWRYPTFSPLGHTFDFYVRPAIAGR